MKTLGLAGLMATACTASSGSPSSSPGTDSPSKVPDRIEMAAVWSDIDSAIESLKDDGDGAGVAFENWAPTARRAMELSGKQRESKLIEIGCDTCAIATTTVSNIERQFERQRRAARFALERDALSHYRTFVNDSGFVTLSQPRDEADGKQSYYQINVFLESACQPAEDFCKVYVASARVDLEGTSSTTSVDNVTARLDREILDTF